MRRLIGLVPRKQVCRVVKEQTIWLKGQIPYNNVSLVPNLKTLENNVCWGLCWRVFFANNSSHALAESAHKWVEISLWLAFTRRESGPEALPAQWDWEQLPRRCQTLQDRGALLLARQHHKPYLGSYCWSFVSDGCTRSCCYHTEKIRHFHYHH